MIYLYAAVLTLLNLVFWLAIPFNLPGTWLMVLLATLVEWWQPGEYMFSWTVISVTAGLAMLGELLEFLLGASGSRQSGGTKRAAALAIAGGVVGALFGTLLPIPVAGTLAGACLGAFAGSLIGDLWAGRSLIHSVTSGRGAAIGRFWGSIAKMIVGASILVILACAAFL